MPKKLNVSIVVPVYNEAGVVEQFHASLAAAVDQLPHKFTFVYVDDGSGDATAASLAALAQKDGRVRVLSLSRNFGHQAALTAGLDHAEGEVVISMDGDGQHPPAMIAEMLALVAQGYDIVQAVHVDDETGFSFKRATSAAFYRLINRISGTHVEPGASDFRAMSRQAVDALKSMPEYHRFLRGMIPWMGFRAVVLPYHPPQRLGGRSKYSLRKMLKLASDAIFSFSLVPLYIGLSAGGLFFLLALIEMIYVLQFWVTGRTSNLEPGWSSLMFVILVASGTIMVLLGFVGVYVGYIFQEVKRRPVYLLRKTEKE
jgi:dolichol-phosphate mannosyltransferase